MTISLRYPPFAKPGMQARALRTSVEEEQLPSIDDFIDELPSIDDFLDTEIAAILAAVDTEVAAILAAVDTEVAAIKAKTDPMTFTATNFLQIDVKKINGTTVNGDGGATPWGP